MAFKVLILQQGGRIGRDDLPVPGCWGAGGSLGTGGSPGTSGQGSSHRPRQEQGQAESGRGQPQPWASSTSLGTELGQGRAGTLAHGWRSASSLVRGTRVRCSPRVSEAIEVVPGSQRGGQILFLYQQFHKPHSYFFSESFQFIMLACRFLFQGNGEEVLFPDLTGTVILLPSIGWLRKDLPSGNLSNCPESLNFSTSAR